MSYHGDIRLGDTIDLKFTTRAYATGAPTTLAGTPVISAYPGNSTTELTAGITLTVDFDARTGMHNVRVVATSGNGYATATNYELVITTGTVGGTSVVGEVIGSFSIENRSALMPTTVGRTLVVDAAGLADANAVKLGPTGAGTAQTARDIGASVLLSTGTGTGQLDFTSGVVNASVGQILKTAFTEGAAGRIAAAFKQFFNIATPAATMDHLILLDTVTTYTGNTLQTADVAARTPAALTANGNMKCSLMEILTTALTETVGQLAGGFKKFFNIATPAATMDHGILVDTITTYTGNTLQTADVAARTPSALTANGNMKSSLVEILTTALTETVGQLAGGFKKFFNIATPAATMDHLILLDTVTTATTASALTTNNDKTGYALGTNGLDSGALTAAAKNAIADGYLDRNMATGADSGTDSTVTRTPRQAMRVLRNKASIAAGVLTVTKEDDTTASWTAAITTTAGNPISTVDPT